MRFPMQILLSLICLGLAGIACTVALDKPTPMPKIEDAPSRTPAKNDNTEGDYLPFNTAAPPTAVPSTATVAGPPGLQYIPNPTLTYLRMFDSSNGWATGVTTLLRTMDGGLHWFNATPQGLRNVDNENFFCLDALNAWLAAHNPDGVSTQIYHTVDGGQTWNITNAPIENLAQIMFVDKLHGYALEDLGFAAGSQYLAIDQTMDGGMTWEEVFTHEPDEEHSLPESGLKNGFSFLDTNNGWIGGYTPTENFVWLYRTTDQGRSWSKVELDLPAGLLPAFVETYPPRFFPPTDGVLPVRLMAADGKYYNIFYTTRNGGESWAQTSAIPNVRAYEFISASEGWASDGNSLMRTFDGAVTWILLSYSGLPEGERFTMFNFVNATTGWALTTNDAATSAHHLYRTNDGGITWTPAMP